MKKSINQCYTILNYVKDNLLIESSTSRRTNITLYLSIVLSDRLSDINNYYISGDCM